MTGHKTFWTAPLAAIISLHVLCLSPVSSRAQDTQDEPSTSGDATSWDDGAQEAATTPASAQIPTRPGEVLLQQGRQSIDFGGYSEQYQSVRGALETGDFSAARDAFRDLQYTAEEREGDEDTEAEEDRDRIGKVDEFLAYAELATLSHEERDYPASIDGFKNAEEILEKRYNRGFLGRMWNSVKRMVGVLFGNEEFGEYDATPNETILTLNYKTLSHLLRGERTAYNVTRRAIEFQSNERKRMQERLAEAEEKSSDLRRTTPLAGTIFGQIQEEFAQYDGIADTVPSAFVNPLGDYISGMVQEFDSYYDPSLLGNARIAYQKASDLLPGNTFLEKTVADITENGLREDKKLVHVIVGDGFSPMYKVLLFGLRVNDSIVPVKIPVLEPEESAVARIDVLSVRNRRLGRLEPLADIQAMMLRNQKDLLPMTMLKVALGTIRSLGERRLLRDLGDLGKVISSIRDLTTTPDLRSWGSLPQRYWAGRLHVSPQTRTVKLRTFNARGRRLSEVEVDLGEASHNFVYGRAIGRHLHADANDSLWIDAGILASVDPEPAVVIPATGLQDAVGETQEAPEQAPAQDEEDAQEMPSDAAPDSPVKHTDKDGTQT